MPANSTEFLKRQGPAYTDRTLRKCFHPDRETRQPGPAEERLEVGNLLPPIGQLSDFPALYPGPPIHLHKHCKQQKISSSFQTGHAAITRRHAWPPLCALLQSRCKLRRSGCYLANQMLPADPRLGQLLSSGHPYHPRAHLHALKLALKMHHYPHKCRMSEPCQAARMRHQSGG